MKREKKHEKRLPALILTAALLLSLCACRDGGVSSGGAAPPAAAESAGAATPTASPAPAPEPTASPKPAPSPAPEPVPEDGELVRVADYIPGISVELKYATTDNFTGSVIYDFTDAYLRYGTVKKLAAVQTALGEMGYSLKIWDAYRPVSAQFALWEACPDATFVANPNTGYSSHSRGDTLDLALVTAEGEEAEMPSGFDDFSAKADRDYGDVSEAAAQNAALLERVMEENGFSGYSAEWWHYSDDGDYGVLEDFPEGFGTAWTAVCEEYLSLRKAPDYGAKVLGKIVAGETVEVLGYSGAFARVRYAGQLGYVLAGYLEPAAGGFFDGLSVVRLSENYGYAEMTADIAALCEKYPSLVTWDSIGTSGEGREIPVLILGDLDAEYHVLVQGAMHGREHITACLLMCMIDEALTNAGDGYLGGTVGEAMEGVCFHIIPMTNPDGVEISRSQTLGAAQRAVYERDRALGYTADGPADYAAQWKANAAGVDLNRNFDAGWEAMAFRDAPSSERYKGEKPLDQSESAALAEYTLKYDFCATLSYHASGSVIFYDYGRDADVIAESRSLAGAVAGETGYGLPESDGEVELDAGGYKDWAMSALKIPSVTVEVGSGDCPLTLAEYFTAFARNRDVLPRVALWAAGQWA